jgi:hypothetical protein
VQNWASALPTVTYTDVYATLSGGQSEFWWGTVYGEGDSVNTYVSDQNGTIIYGPYVWAGYGSFSSYIPYASTFYVVLQNNWLFYTETVDWSSQICGPAYVHSPLPLFTKANGPFPLASPGAIPRR